MRKMKKIMAVVLSLTVALTMGIATTAFSFADNKTPESGTAKITITRDASYTAGDGSTTESGNETYTYYRILFATYADGDLDNVNENNGELSGTKDGKVAYYVTDSAEADALKTLKVKNASSEQVDLFAVTKTTDGSKYNVVLAYKDATAVQIADALDTIKSSFPSANVNADGTNGAKIQNVAKGYYLIESSLGNKLAVQTLGEVTIKEKNTYPTVDKKQDDETTPTYANDDVHVKVGDTVYYSVEVQVPATANGDITLTDTMSAGLTYDSTTGLAWSIKDSEGTAGTITADAGETKNDYALGTAGSGETWKAVVHANDNTRGKTITVTYQATVNASALTTDTTKQNEIKLEYSNYTQKETVNYDTSATGMIKFDGDKAEVVNNEVVLKSGQTGTFKLANAEFKLQVQNGTGWEDMEVVQETGYYRPMNGTETAATIKSDSNGEIIIRGLDGDKTYQLVETKAPADGYNLATTPVSLTLTTDAKAGVTISGDASDTVTKLAAANVGKLANNKGAQLPSTGGIGTTIFYILGALLVVGAGILLVARRRMNAND